MYNYSYRSHEALNSKASLKRCRISGSTHRITRPKPKMPSFQLTRVSPQVPLIAQMSDPHHNRWAPSLELPPWYTRPSSQFIMYLPFSSVLKMISPVLSLLRNTLSSIREEKMKQVTILVPQKLMCNN